MSAHKVENLRFQESKLILTIDGQDQTFELLCISKALSEASEAQRNTYEISPSGYGIHWPQIDEDVSIDGLMGIAHSPYEEKNEKLQH